MPDEQTAVERVARCAVTWLYVWRFQHVYSMVSAFLLAPAIKVAVSITLEILMRRAEPAAQGLTD